MSRIFNFNAGPAVLPLAVLERARDELVDFQGRGMSLLEMSHRSKEYEAVHDRAKSLLRELLGMPSNYEILFLGGGATLQFSMVPLNLLAPGKSCDFTLTGAWAKKAHADARKVGRVNVVFDGKADDYRSLPGPLSLKLDPEAAYLHLTSNETIGGVQWHEFPDSGAVPLVCDMSSDFLSRRVPVGRFGLIYAGAQKNVGPAGASVILVREDLLARSPDSLTAYLSYKVHAAENSLYNTPPVFAVYVMGLVLEWVSTAGGLAGMERLADLRAGLLYQAIERSAGFYRCPIPAGCRSKMNVVFRLPSEELEQRFLEKAKGERMQGLKGHRSVGGIRASIYNAMPVEGAQSLAAFMDDFGRKNG